MKPTDPNAQVVSEYYSYAVVSTLLKHCEATTHPLPNHTAQAADCPEIRVGAISTLFHNGTNLRRKAWCFLLLRILYR